MIIPDNTTSSKDPNGTQKPGTTDPTKPTNGKDPTKKSEPSAIELPFVPIE